MRLLPPASGARRRGMSLRSAAVGALLWCAVIVWGIQVLWQTPPNQSAGPTGADSAEAMGTDDAADGDTEETDSGAAPQVTISFPAKEIPDFTVDECQGESLSLSDLKGRPWVIAFVFTRCVTTCPQITLAMKQLQDRVGDDNTDVMYVNMTVDPDYDTPEILNRYSEIYEPNRDRWKFVTGEKDYLHNLIVHGFGSYVKENLGDNRRAGYEVAHSNRVILVNEDGIPVGTFLGTNAGDMSKLARILQGKKPFPKPGPPIQLLTPDTGGPEGMELMLVPTDDDQDSDDEESAPTEEAEPTTSGDSQPEENAADNEDESAVLTPLQRQQKIDRLMPQWAALLPMTNAVLNGTATLLLACGWVAIRGGHRESHRNLMTSAFVVSVVFLACYLTSHWALGHYTGERGRPFAGGSSATLVYHLILWPHIALAATVPVLAIRVFQHAAAERWEAHRKLARITFPIWMYVSITGVVIYTMLYHWNPSPA